MGATTASMAKSSGKTAMAMTRFHQKDNPGLETRVMIPPRLIWQRESNPRPFSVWGKCGEKHFPRRDADAPSPDGLWRHGERQSEALKVL